MDTVKDHQSAAPLGKVHGRIEVSVHRPRQLIDMFVRPRTDLVRRQGEHLASLPPEREVEQPDEVSDCHLYNGKVESQQAFQLPAKVQEYLSEGVRDLVSEA